MLFHSSVRRELARSFGATLVVLVTVVMTITLIRTLGEAGRGVFDPADVMLIMGYIVLADMPTILSLALFIAVLSVLTRMYRDSEMVIWFGAGRGLTALLAPLYRFAWPILLVVTALSLLILPWAYGRIEDLRDRYEKRGDLARVEPGQFQESANGDRVFFIEKDDRGRLTGNNVFIATKKGERTTVTSAQSGRIEWVGAERFLVLENGQRLERTVGKTEISLASFARYGMRIEGDDVSGRSFTPAAARTTLELVQDPSAPHLAEMAWRAGLALAACNFVLIGLAAAGMNPRAGRTANLGFAFMAFVVYYNLLVLGKSWIETGQIRAGVFLLTLHGGAFLFAAIVLAKRQHNWHAWRPRRMSAPSKSSSETP